MLGLVLTFLIIALIAGARRQRNCPAKSLHRIRRRISGATRGPLCRSFQGEDGDLYSPDGKNHSRSELNQFTPPLPIEIPSP